MIIWLLLENGVLRFGQIKRKIQEAMKITDKMLIQCLRELEESGILSREVFPVVPPKVEYSLTSKGEELRPLFESLIVFGLSHKQI